MGDKDNQKTIRSRSEDVFALFRFCAAWHAAYTAQKDLAHRFAIIENGEERRKQAEEELHRLCFELLDTFPLEKRPLLTRQINDVRYVVTMGLSAHRDDCSVLLREDDLAGLAKAAHEQCKLCLTPDRCRRCDLGKTFDAVLKTDRDGGSWQGMIV